MRSSRRSANEISGAPGACDEETAMKKPTNKGMRKGLTSYGDPEFSLFLRKSFIKAMGYSDAALELPVIASPTLQRLQRLPWQVRN